MTRFCRFSIRSILIVVSVLAIYFAYRANAAREQRRDVAIIHYAGGTVYYDWMLQPIYDADGNIPYFKILTDADVIDAPKWMRETLGDEYFQQVVKVHLPVNAIDDAVLAALSNLRGLTEIDLLPNSPEKPPLTKSEIDGLRERLSQASNAQVAGPFGSPEL
jgi:hypothetical protein